MPEPICGKCGADLRETGFVAVSTVYQVYAPYRGALIRSHKSKGGLQNGRCHCGEICNVDIRAIAGKAKKAA